jgi:serine/threonine protein kinase
VLRGKFGYLSPEQVRGLPVDRRSDVFAAGVVLYEMLTGRRLFAGGSDLAILEKVKNGEASPPSRVNPAVPRALDAIVLHALARQVEDRTAWASELRDALAPFVLGVGESSLAQLLAFHFPFQVQEELARIERLAHAASLRRVGSAFAGNGKLEEPAEMRRPWSREH